MKRIGIFFFWEAAGVVDRYVEYYLQQLKKVCDYLLVVANGHVEPQGLEILANNSDDMIGRDNTGFDAWAYKTAIEHIGWDEIYKADEILLANATIFGPISSIEEMFSRAEKIECDYWGLTRVYEDKEITNQRGVDYPGGYRPDFVMSNFWVVRSKLLHSPEFRRHWDELAPINSYFESSVLHETVFTREMEKAGFVFATLDEAEFRYSSPCTSVHDAYNIMTETKVPFIRRKAFFDPNSDNLRFGFDVPRKVIDYVAECTDYDEGMIWENLLRTTNLYSLNKWMNFSKMIHEDRVDRDSQGLLRVAVIQHIFDAENIDYCIKHLLNFPSGTDIRFIARNDELLEEIRIKAAVLGDKELSFVSVPEAENEVSALLIGGAEIVCSGKYDLVCTLSDTAAEEYRFKDELYQFLNSGYDNIAGNKNIVDNIIAMFEHEKNLGIVIPPIPHAGKNFLESRGGWKTTQCMRNTKSLMDKLQIKCPIDYFQPIPAPLGKCFWFRCSALRALFEYCWDPGEIENRNVESFNRLYTLTAQSAGFYPALVRTERNAAFELNLSGSDCTDYSILLNQMFPACRSSSSAAMQIKRARAAFNSNIFAKGADRIGRNSGFKHFAKQVMPIGMWNILRRNKHQRLNEYYEDEISSVPMPRKAIKWICPRFIWEFLKAHR